MNDTALIRRAMFGLALGAAIALAHAAGEPLELIATIAMPAVKGRIDHLAADVERHRLFVAALGNDSLEVLDIARNRHEKGVPGFSKPQGVVYVPGINRLFVSNGRSGRLDMLDATSLATLKRMDKLDDADNVRYDPAGRKAFVGYGRGAIRMLDVNTAESAGEIALPGHPESFQLELKGNRIFVNVPEARHVAVLDRAKGEVLAKWDLSGASANFPMALDENGRRLFVGARSPTVMLVYDIGTGKVVAKMPIGGDTDDIFFDDERKRIYVICGEGRIDIFRQDDPDRYAPEGTVKTGPRARTGLYVAEERKLYVAAPAAGSLPARVFVYRIH